MEKTEALTKRDGILCRKVQTKAGEQDYYYLPIMQLPDGDAYRVWGQILQSGGKIDASVDPAYIGWLTTWRDFVVHCGRIILPGDGYSGYALMRCSSAGSFAVRICKLKVDIPVVEIATEMIACLGRMATEAPGAYQKFEMELRMRHQEIGGHPSHSNLNKRDYEPLLEALKTVLGRYLGETELAHALVTHQREWAAMRSS